MSLIVCLEQGLVKKLPRRISLIDGGDKLISVDVMYFCA